MFHEVNNILVGNHKSTDRGKRFAVRPHDDIHVLFHAEMLGSTPSGLSQDADAMGIVHHEPGAVFPAERYDLRKGRNITFHAVHTVNNDELPPVSAFLQNEL